MRGLVYEERFELSAFPEGHTLPSWVTRKVEVKFTVAFNYEYKENNYSEFLPKKIVEGWIIVALILHTL